MGKIFLLIFPSTVFAYVDPGLGGLLFQVGYIIFTAFMAAMVFWFKPIKKFFQRIKHRSKNKKEDE